MCHSPLSCILSPLLSLYSWHLMLWFASLWFCFLSAFYRNRVVTCGFPFSPYVCATSCLSFHQLVFLIIMLFCICVNKLYVNMYVQFSRVHVEPTAHMVTLWGSAQLSPIVIVPCLHFQHIFTRLCWTVVETKKGSLWFPHKDDPLGTSFLQGTVWASKPVKRGTA